MNEYPTPAALKLRAKLFKPSQCSEEDLLKRVDTSFDSKKFIRMAKKIQKDLHPEDILIDANNTFRKAY